MAGSRHHRHAHFWLIFRARLLRVNGRLRGPVNGFTRTVTVPLEVEPTSPTVRGRNRFYGPSFRNFTGRLYALEWTSENVLELCKKFYVSPWSDRHAYITIC